MIKSTINDFQQKVYNLCSQIPAGYVSTYKHLARFLNTSPRVIGQALKNNPYPSTKVPCHRVIAANYFIGGFRGQWGQGEKVMTKKKKLNQEGIYFDEKGYLRESFRNKVIAEFSTII